MKPLFFRKMLLTSLLLTATGGRAADSSMRWERDYETALSRANRENRLLAVHFWLQGRPLVEAMQTETFGDPGVVRLSNEKFVHVRIDIRADPGLFERAIGGRGGLATCVMDGSGDVVSLLPGYALPKTYLRFLERALAGHSALRKARANASQRPGDLPAIALLAAQYEALHSPRRAESEYERLTELSEKTVGDRAQGIRHAALGHERLARFRAMRGKNREAAEHLRSYRMLDPFNRIGILDRALLTEAIVCWIERRLKDAAKILEGALQRFPSSGERDQMLLATGTVRHESGDDPGALALLQQILKDYPESNAAEQAAAQIDHIRNPPPDHAH